MSYSSITNEVTPLPLIRASLWGKYIGGVTQADYDEMKHHAIVALPASMLTSVCISSDLYQKWKNDIVKQIAYNERCRYAQSMLPLTIPYVILKGTSAAQYYKNPDYRTLGDIDIMIKPEDEETACEMLLKNGYRETTNVNEVPEYGQRSFAKYGIIVDVHFSVAALNDADKSQKFDALVIRYINDTHVLPDLINGLIILQHINQHLQEGIGLRQILDWMMFVDKCITDEKWKDLHQYLTEFGLDNLAVIITRMCEIFLGLSEHPWSKSANEQLCTKLIQYILSCGNFGRKKSIEEKKTYYRSFKYTHPIKAIKELQHKGSKEWKAARIPILKYFAWMWKGSQYVKDIPFMMNHHRTIQSREKMLEELGVKIQER